jgi:DNA-binding MarR family transcriptional regulator
VDATEDLSDRLRSLTTRQQRFERSLARQLAVDAAGLAAMEHLVTNGPATPTELAHHLDISTAATTLVVDRLASAGHVTRQAHPSDGRKVVVTAASSSAEAAYGHVALLLERIEQLDASMSVDERTTVARFLERIVDIYDEADRKLR